MSRGLGAVERKILEQFAREWVPPVGGRFIPYSWWPLASEFASAEPSSVRRAARNLSSKGWLDVVLGLNPVPYRLRHDRFGEHVTAWVTQHALFGRLRLGDPHPDLVERLPRKFVEAFDDVLDFTLDGDDDSARDLWLSLQRDHVRWRDAMGATLTMRIAYARYAAGLMEPPPQPEDRPVNLPG